MPNSSFVLKETEPVPAGAVQVFGEPGIFPAPLGQQLMDLSDLSGERKLTYQWPQGQHEEAKLPEPIADAISFITPFGHSSNTAVLKRYSLEDEQESGAYELHTDPDIYDSERLALISLSGFAQLTVQARNKVLHTFNCHPNTVLFVAPNLAHRITPPLNRDGVRHFLFLGYDKTR